MKIGFLSTRLAGTDGVSLETRKWAEVAQRLGHEVYYCAGQLDDDAPNPTLIPELHFRDPEAMAIGEMVFGRLEPPPGLVGAPGGYGRDRLRPNFESGWPGPASTCW